MNSLTQSCRVLLLCAVLVAIAVPAHGQSKTAALNTEQLTAQSDIVVAGKVAGLVSEWSPKHDRIQTRVTVSVDQSMKGNAAGSAITVLVPGGEVDGVGEWYSHSVSFQNNEDVVLFAKQESGHYRVVGGEAGKLSVQRDEKTGAKFIPHMGSLEEFSKNIVRISKAQSSGQIKN